jgi:hypothetical protein
MIMSEYAFDAFSYETYVEYVEAATSRGYEKSLFTEEEWNYWREEV